MPTKRSRILKPRTKAGGHFTEQGYIGWIRSWLRRAWLKYPVRYQALNAAKKTYMEGKRKRVAYQCAMCNNWFSQKEVEVDHIHGCGEFTKLDHLPTYAKKLFCEPEDVRVLCKKCHKGHSANQREARKKKAK